MKLKASNQIAMELAVFLQLKGSGVYAHNGEAHPVYCTNEAELIDYLHLGHLGEDDARRSLQRAFKSLHSTGGYPKYHRMHLQATGYVWYCKNPEYKKPSYLIK